MATSRPRTLSKHSRIPKASTAAKPSSLLAGMGGWGLKRSAKTDCTRVKAISRRGRIKNPTGTVCFRPDRNRRSLKPEQIQRDGKVPRTPIRQSKPYSLAATIY
jgi:hypothetical protein